MGRRAGVTLVPSPGKIDLKASLDPYRARRGEFRILDVPEMRYLMVDGQGDPNTSPEYAAALQTLYPVAYALKFASKAAGRDYVVPSLEGLWWAEDLDAFTTARDKSAWDWTMMILVPDWLDAAEVTAALDEPAAKRAKKPGGGPARLDDVRFATLTEGRCVQTLHLGPFDEEAGVLEEMHHRFIPANGLELTGTHHEVYLSDPRRTAPERLRTIPRQPVRAAAGANGGTAGEGAGGTAGPEDLESRIAALLSERLAARRDPGSGPRAGTVQRRWMFGHRGFMVGGKLALTSGRDGLLVRVDPERSAELLKKPGARQAVMGERDMGPSWLTVDAAAVDTGEALADWIDLALDYNSLLTHRP
ncbi:GyrI-like domain-containing protein [Citricoccus sp. I39-566]|nr:GyrI-like domain-containing protein [Citricoccus sp. I39-566]WMY78804.1 GyrI-like domain-containing protein [Citricoccus sp. I39-566]